MHQGSNRTHGSYKHWLSIDPFPNIGGESPKATAAPTATSSLLDRLKPMAAAVERMLNTVSCCVDRLQVHLHLPAPAALEPGPASEQQPHTSADDDASEQPERCTTQRSWCVVLRAGSLKLVDTSDCFMATPGIIGDAAATLDPERAVEVSKSLFWDDLSIAIVPGAPADGSSSSPETDETRGGAPCLPCGAASVTPAAGRGYLQPSGRVESAAEASGGWSWGDTGTVQAGSESGGRVSSPDGGPGGSSVARSPVATTAQTESAHAAGGSPMSSDVETESPLLQANDRSGSAGAELDSESEGFRDAEEQSDDGAGAGGGRELVLFTGAGGSGWRGKATLQLAWAAVAHGGALKSVRVAVESCEGVVVGVAAEQVAALAEAAAAVAEVVERRARECERMAAGPAVALADVTTSMLGALRPGQGMQDVLAMAAEGGDVSAGREGLPFGEASSTTEMHDARSMLASSMMVKPGAPVAETGSLWQLKLDLQAPEAQSGAEWTVPAVSVSIWDTAGDQDDGNTPNPFGLAVEIGNITGHIEQSGHVPFKATSRIQGVLPHPHCPPCSTKVVATQAG